MADIVKFMKNTFFGKKKNKKDKKKNKHQPLDFEAQDDINVNSCYHSNIKPTHRRPVKSVAMGENLDSPCSDDSDTDNRSRAPTLKRVTFNNKTRRHSIDRQSVRSHRNSKLNVDDAEYWRKEAMKLHEMLNYQERTHYELLSNQHRNMEKYMKLRDRYSDVKSQKKHLEQKVNELEESRRLPPPIHQTPQYQQYAPQSLPQNFVYPTPPESNFAARVAIRPFQQINNMPDMSIRHHPQESDIDERKYFNTFQEGAHETLASDLSCIENFSENERSAIGNGVVNEDLVDIEGNPQKSAARDDGYNTSTSTVQSEHISNDF